MTDIKNLNIGDTFTEVDFFGNMTTFIVTDKKLDTEGNVVSVAYQSVS